MNTAAAGAVVELHPAMTLHQVAAWCAHHRKVVRLDWRVTDFERIPVAVVLDENPDDELPAFLRPQAD